MTSMTNFDMELEALTLSSMREIAAVTAAWESNPLRWQQDPAQWPELLETSLDSEYYVAHPLQDPTDLLEATTITNHDLFSPRMRTLLLRLHRVLIRDADPAALSVAMLDEVDPAEPSRRALAHVEMAGRAVMVQTDRELLAVRDLLTRADWEQLAAVWAKVSSMLSLVTTFLSSTGELTTLEARTARVIEQQAAATAGVVTQLQAAGVDRLADLPRQ